MASSRFLFNNGVLLSNHDVPSVTTLLEAHTGAYTTTRTHNNASFLLFWEKHLHRLSSSVRILCDSRRSSLVLPETYSKFQSVIQCLVNDSMSEVLPASLRERKDGEELAVTALVSGDLMSLGEDETIDVHSLSRILDVHVHVHVGGYVVPEFAVRGNGARLSVVGRGRELAASKYSDWVRLRKPLERLRAPSVTELLLSNDGDHILEGCLTNVFVVCRKDRNEVMEEYLHNKNSTHHFEVQTAPVGDGVLPGVIRQLVIDVCLNKGISVREVAPSWSENERWEEAFITNSLRLVQHVETVAVPNSWESLDCKTWKEILWKEKKFEENPGMLTAIVQKEIMHKASTEGYLLTNFA